MPEGTKIVLEWTYSPKNFFEEKIEFRAEQYELVLDDGKASVTMDADVYDCNPIIREQLDQQLEDRFLGAQLINRQPFELSKSVLCRIHPDGRKDIAISIHSAVMVASAGTLDIIVRDAEGNIITDSKQERLERRERFAELAAKFRGIDTTADGILLSFNASVQDPDNELIHLYEIRDALYRRFGKDSVVQNELGISNSRWRRLGRLANTEPIRQGRHRGQHTGVLRDATPNELKSARDIAVEMIFAYLEYLEKNA